MTPEIPLHRPFLTGKEMEYLKAAAGGRLSGDGPFTRRCQALLEQSLGVGRAFLTPSGTHALELAALLLDLGPGDEVVVPAFTFPSTATAFLLRGARPVFADIRPDTLNLDESRLEQRLTPRTRAVAPVHYAGVGCEMEVVLTIARSRGIAVVEDNAHGLFGLHHGRALGAFGCLSALSFHETKSFTCGEGGALLVNDPDLFERAEILRDKGTDRARFFRGEVDRYTWVDSGSSGILADLAAAFLLAQLEARDDILTRRRALWTRYAASLADWASENGVQLPAATDPTTPPQDLFYLLLPDPRRRPGFLARLKDAGVNAAFHYLPLHLSAMGRKLGGRPGDCPVAESASERLVRLPFYTGLSPEDQDRVIEAVRATSPL